MMSAKSIAGTFLGASSIVLSYEFFRSKIARTEEKKKNITNDQVAYIVCFSLNRVKLSLMLFLLNGYVHYYLYTKRNKFSWYI